MPEFVESIREGGLFIFKNRENLFPLFFRTYKGIRRLKFCFQLYNNVYYAIVMGVDFGVIWAADFDNAIRFYVHPIAGQGSPAVRRHKKI